MTRTEALERLRAHRDYLGKEFGAVDLAVFGSMARDDAAAGSDNDVLVRFDGPATSKRHFGLQFNLEDLLGCSVDPVTDKVLRPELCRPQENLIRRCPMAKKNEKSEPVDQKILRNLNRRATAVQDAARGIPEQLLTEYEEAQRAIERALRNSSADIRKAIDGAETVSGKLLESDEEQRKAFAFHKPTSEEIISVLAGYPPSEVCGVRDFVLPFIRGQADQEFGTESPITTVRQGIVGWGDQSNPPPRMVNTGSESGQTLNGNLDLYWRVTIPHDGIFAVRPNQTRPSFPVFGSHTVRGRGWYFSSNDARVEVHAWVIVYLGGHWLEARHEVISSDATRSENRTRSFGAWVDLPGRVTFQAQEGQELGMIVRLYGQTWANDEGLAEININTFGLPSNMVEDMNIDVVD